MEVFGFGGGNDKKRKIFDDDSRADSNERESDLNDKSWRKDSGADDDKSLVSSSLDQSAGLIQLQPYDFDNIPPYSCVYCGIHDTRCVVQCKICNKWFCNGKGHPQGSSNDKNGAKYQQYGSHIVWHMVKSNHK